MKREPYPLQWPEHWPRTRGRVSSRFSNAALGRSIDDLLNELRRFEARQVALTSDLRLRLDGIPYAQQAEPDDPGIAVYFQWRGKPYVIACDRYKRCWENMRAVAKTVEAMRAIERHGASQLLERAVSGFSALPPAGGKASARPPERPWWEVLGMPDMQVPYVTIASDETHPMRIPALGMAKALYQNQVGSAHPDKGGSTERMAELNIAWKAAKEALGG